MTRTGGRLLSTPRHYRLKISDGATTSARRIIPTLARHYAACPPHLSCRSARARCTRRQRVRSAAYTTFYGIDVRNAAPRAPAAELNTIAAWNGSAAHLYPPTSTTTARRWRKLQGLQVHRSAPSTPQIRSSNSERQDPHHSDSFSPASASRAVVAWGPPLFRFHRGGGRTPHDLRESSATSVRPPRPLTTPTKKARPRMPSTTTCRREPRPCGATG